MLITLADILNCEVTDLLPLDEDQSLSGNPELISRINQINELSASEQNRIISIIDAFLKQQVKSSSL